MGHSKSAVALIGLLAGSLGSFPRVRHTQAGGNDQDFRQRPLFLRLQQHAPEQRIDRQARQLASQRRQFPDIIHRPQFIQQRIATVNGGRRRGI